jgi:hypothetical protein
LFHGILKEGIGGQNVNLPTFRSSKIGQAQYDRGGPAKAGVADDVQESHRIRFFTGEHM